MQPIEKITEMLTADPFLITEEITPQTELTQLVGWDSFKHISFLMQLEMEFDIDIEVEDAAEMNLVANILKKLS